MTYDGQSDHDLLLGGLTASLAENQAAADKWSRLLVYFRRREADDAARRAESEHFALTPRQQTVVEVGELWGLTEGRVRHQLNVVLWLSEHAQFAWELCQSGQLDTYRATTIADTARNSLDTPEEYAALIRRIDPFLRGHLREVPGIEVPLVLCTPKQLRNKLSYEIRKIRTGDAQQRFARAYANRDITTSDGEDGILQSVASLPCGFASWLTLAGTTDQVQLAGHRLTLAAKQARAAGDPRTLNQLRTDLALDLLITGTTTEAPLPRFARPVVNLTVPIQTVMGLADDPGVLSGGTVIPAGLARVIAQQPGSTWHRMLTDPAGECLEVSTKSYQPTTAIWSQVVAEHTTCFRPGCDRASTLAELDHRIPWPEGPTSPWNLWPACKSDHKAKHAPGFAITTTETGGFTLTTPAGFSHPVLKPVHPHHQDWPDIDPVQFSATELLDAITDLRAREIAARPLRFDLGWEYHLPVPGDLAS